MRITRLHEGHFTPVTKIEVLGRTFETSVSFTEEQVFTLCMTVMEEEILRLGEMIRRSNKHMESASKGIEMPMDWGEKVTNEAKANKEEYREDIG